MQSHVCYMVFGNMSNLNRIFSTVLWLELLCSMCVCVCGCYVGAAEVPHPRTKCPGTSSFPVHTTESHHRGKQRPEATERSTVEGLVSAADVVRRRASSELPLVEGNGIVDEFGRCLDQEPVISVYDLQCVDCLVMKMVGMRWDGDSIYGDGDNMWDGYNFTAMGWS